MAKSCATLIALFCLFTLSLASDALPGKDEVSTQVSLPNPNESGNSEKQSNHFVLSSVPLTKIPFRTVNRRFPVRLKRPCRHHHRVHRKVKEHEEIPYDVIFSASENSDFEEPVVHRGVRRITRWLRLHDHDHHHHHDEDSGSDNDEDTDRIKRIAFKLYGYDRLDRENEVKVLKKLRKHIRLQNGEEEKKKRMNGFMRHVRKFLDHYF